MSASFGILRVAPFAGFVQRFDDLIGSATTMSLYFIHSRRWRENHDSAIKAFVARAGTTLEGFLPISRITSFCTFWGNTLWTVRLSRAWSGVPTATWRVW